MGFKKLISCVLSCTIILLQTPERDCLSLNKTSSVKGADTGNNTVSFHTLKPNNNDTLITSYNGTNRTGRRLHHFEPKSYRKQFKYYPVKSKMKITRQGLAARKTGAGLMDESVNSADLLRTKVLTQLGDVDPLFCLPKALCGISSQKKLNLEISQIGVKSNPSLNTDFDTNPLDFMNDESINNYIEIMKNIVPKTEPSQRLKKTKRKSKAPIKGFERYNSDLSEESDESNELSADDEEYFREKAQIEHWMQDDEFNPEPNWWDLLENNHNHLQETENTDSWSSFSPWRISKSLSSMFGSMMPMMSFGLGKAPNVFADDPFFQDFRSFRGRSLNSNGETRGFNWLFGSQDKTIDDSNMSGKSRLTPIKSSPSIKFYKRKNRRNKKHSRQDVTALEKDKTTFDDPVEKFQLALEIGKEMTDPKQCDYIFTGCPFTYLEIIDIIESSKKSLDQEKLGAQKEIIVSTSDGDSIVTTPTPADEPLPSTNEESLDNEMDAAIPHVLSLGNGLELSLKVSDANNNPLFPLMSSKKQHSKKKPKIKVKEILPNDTLVEDLNIQESVINEETEAFYNRDPKPTPYRTVPELAPIVPQMDITTVAPYKNSKRRRKPKPKRKPQRINNRKQWGWGPNKIFNRHPRPSKQFHVSQQPSQISLPERITTKYEPVPMPTTINKPSHVTNYHFYNSNANTSPQVLSPTTIPSHQSSFPILQNILNVPHKSTQKEIIQTEAISTTSENPIVQKTSSKTEKIKGDDALTKYRHDQSSEERIVIRIPERSPNNNNHYYNLIPSIPFLNNIYTTQQPHSHPHAGMYQQRFPVTPSLPQQYYNNENQYPYRQPILPYYQSSQMPPLPFSPPGMFSYIFGKK